MANIPMVFVNGSHYDVGYQTAKTFCNQVKYYYEHHDRLAEYEAYYKTPAGLAFCEGLLAVGRTRFPHYMDEMKGISDGAGIDLMKVQLVHLEREIDTQLKLQSTQKKGPPPDGCSDFHVNTEKEMLIGHNEDWERQMAGQDVLVCARIDPYKSPDGRTFEGEKYVVHTWPGLIPGLTSGFNHHGMAFSINYLYPRGVSTARTADHFLGRRLLTGKNIADVVDILTDEGTGAAIGFSVNVGFVGENKLWNIEVAASNGKASSLVDKIEVHRKSTERAIVSNYAHFNNFERLQVPAEVLQMSTDRKNRYNSLPAPTDVATVCAMLGDYETTDNKFPIYQPIDPTVDWATVASVVMDFCRKRMVVFKTRPINSKPAAVIPFNILDE